MSSSTLRSKGVAEGVAALGPWFHNLHLPDGTQTAPDHPLGDYPSFKWRKLGSVIPQDLRGWRVLDIGCNAGFYAFELARRGASVVAIDHDPHYLTQARWAAAQFGLADRIEFREQQVYELASAPDTFDLVWFMGVLYHLRYPMLALDIVVRRVRGLLMMQTLTMPDAEPWSCAPDYGIAEREVLASPGWPRLAFVERRFANDPTNWWIPNRACAEAMLRAAGMRIIGRPADETILSVPDSEPQACEAGERELRAALGR